MYTQLVNYARRRRLLGTTEPRHGLDPELLPKYNGVVPDCCVTIAGIDAVGDRAAIQRRQDYEYG